MCQHSPHCPTSDAADACGAQVRTPRPEQGWYLLCNGVIFFDDGGAILPNGTVLEVEVDRIRPPSLQKDWLRLSCTTR